MTRNNFIKYTALTPFAFFFGRKGFFGESHEKTNFKNEDSAFPNFATEHFFADIHAHVTLKPFNSDDKPSPWQRIDNVCTGKLAKWMVNATKAVPRTSQCHLEGLARGNVRLVCCSLVPLERGMIVIPFINKKKKGDATHACVSGINTDHDWAYLKKNDIAYNENLHENIDYLKQYEHKTHTINGSNFSFEIAKNGAHLQEILKNPNKIAIVLTIEGGHALSHSLALKDDSTQNSFKQEIVANTLKIKLLDTPIFSINLTHFFWNGLCGHARTLNGAQMALMNQRPHLNDNITPLGKEIVLLLLDKTTLGANQKPYNRILIDTKHLSLAARKWYYRYVETQRKKGDNIPIICSHTGIAGLSWNDKKCMQPDTAAKNKHTYLNIWAINLYDEDILAVYKSNGLIGIMLDKYKLVGDIGKKTYKNSVAGSEMRRTAYIQAIWANFLSAVKAINDKKAWDILCIGSDFDGMITPFEPYSRANDMPELAHDLQAFLENPTDIPTLFSQKEIKNLCFDLSPTLIVQKIMRDNAFNFIQKHL
jgi:microsomal dipeptidase-like Zn-dependent dipeptidase